MTRRRAPQDHRQKHRRVGTPRWPRGVMVVAVATCSLLSLCMGNLVAIAKPLPGVAASSTRATRQALLASVCDGRVQGATCRECPSITSEAADTEPIVVGPFHTGSFVTANATEAYVGLTGCDSKPAGYTGAVLLRRVRGKWKVLRYDSGADIRSCLPYTASAGKVMLACYSSGEPGGRGVFAESVAVLTPTLNETTRNPLLTVRDNTGGCFDSKDAVAFESWAKQDLNGDKRADLILAVTESHGSADVVTCTAGPPGQVVRHRIAFLFDGKRFKVSSSAVATVACLDSSTSGSGPTSYCPATKP